MKNKFLTEYLKANLRSCQLHQLEILKIIDGICKKYSIEYWLDGGTLLGAVRHGGFIPWDDDIDIAMTAEGLNMFINKAPLELPDHLFLQTKSSDSKCKEPIVKIRDLNSLYIETGDVFSVEYEKGIFVDIFPFVPCAKMPISLHKHITKGISKSYSILIKQHYYSVRSFAEFFWFGMKYITFSAMWELYNSVFSKNEYICNVPTNNGMGLRHKFSTVFPLGKILFEGLEFPAPNCADIYLTDQYGDYMQIPPEEKRKVHACYYSDRLI